MKKNRLYILGFIGACLSSATVNGCSTANLRKPLQAGKYTVPILPNWQHETYNSSFMQTTTQRAVVNGTTISIKFLCFLHPSNYKPPTSAQDLNSEVQNEEQSLNADASARSLNRTILSTPMQYKKWPAFLTVRQKSERGRVSEAKILRFTDGQNLYWFQSTIGGKTIDPQAKSIADQAWATLTRGLDSAPYTSRFAPWLPIMCLVIGVTVAVASAVFLKSRSKYKKS